MAPLARIGCSALISALLWCGGLSAVAENARFDLAGPKVDIRVTRQGKALPIAMVPNLEEGDQLWLHADLPATQSVKYLLVAVFLRGTTNPPPENWILKFPTWDKRIRAEGAQVTVPQGAQQVLLLLAPETGGDISALRSAVRGRPGVFVRASQDLAEAGFEQARIEKYLSEMQQVPPGDSKALADHSDLLARTLNLKPNADCYKKPVDQQYSCLTQSGTQTLLDDGHGQSVVNSLTSGASSDLIGSVANTQMAGGGMYSAYVGAIVDVVRIMSNLHTAHYQYIPAIAFPDQESLNLRLNVPPSFENPKSVIVIGLPAVQKATPPPLRDSDPEGVTCLLKPGVALPVEGAPLVFSTSFAHDLMLHRDLPKGVKNLPLTPDAFQGGLVVHAAAEGDRQQLPMPSDTAPPPGDPARKGAPLVARVEDGGAAAGVPIEQTATVEGLWGFDHFTGPALPVQELPGADWKLTTAGDHIIVGEENHLLLSSTGTACLESVIAQEAGQPDQKLAWKASDKKNQVKLDLTLRSSNPGAVRLVVRQYGSTAPDTLALQAFSKPAELQGVVFHLGDRTLTVMGRNLGEVRQLRFDSAVFSRSALAPADTAPRDIAEPPSDATEVQLNLAESEPLPKAKAGAALMGEVSLADGRTLSLPFTVLPARPVLSVLSHRVIRTKTDTANISLLNADDVPLDSQLVLSFRSTANFPRDAQIEIASEDKALHDVLTLEDGSLVLQDRHTVVAQLDLHKVFGGSAFGLLRVRMVLHDGTAGDWMPLVTLVRLPILADLLCPAGTPAECTLTGVNLYLVSQFATDASFTKTTDVPDGFVGTSMTVQKPASGLLYLKLRDDPSAVATAALTPHS